MLDGVVIDYASVLNAKLGEWERFLQLRTPSRRSGRPNALRKIATKDEGLGVSRDS